MSQMIKNAWSILVSLCFIQCVHAQQQNAPPNTNTDTDTSTMIEPMQQTDSNQSDENQETINESAIQLDPIQVTGDTFFGTTVFRPVDGYRANNASTATRSDTPVIDTPAAISIITQDALEDANIDVLDEIADFTPGITRSNSFGVTRNRLRARGFETDILINGFSRGVIGITDTYRLERVETVRGPVSALYGSGNGGAQVNAVTKRPLYEPLYSAALEAANEDARYQGTFDISQPLTENGSIALRINGLAEDNDSFRRFIDQTTLAIAPSLRIDAGENTSILLEAEYVSREQPFDRGVPIINNEFAAPIDSNFTEPDAGDNDNQTASIQTTIKQYLSDNWSVSGRLSFDRQTLKGESLDNRALAPFSFDIGTPLAILGGAPAPFSVTANDTIYRNRTIRDQDRQSYFADLTVNGLLLTGTIEHRLTAGAQYRNETQENRDFRSFTSFNSLDYYLAPCNIDISNPQYGNCQAVADRPSFSDREGGFGGVFAQNQIDINDQWQLLAGFSYNQYDVSSENTLTNAETTFDGDKFSPRLGLVYQPLENLSLYASYGTGFSSESVRTNPITDEVLPPLEYENFEVGFKTELLANRLSLSLALFQLEEENEVYADPDSVDFANPDAIQFRDDGLSRSRGLELELVGQVIPQWDVRFSYAYIDAEIRQGFESSGTDLAETPKHNIGLLTQYAFASGTLDGVSLGVSWVYESRRRVDNITEPNFIVNPVDLTPVITDDASDLPSEYLPSYHRFDLFAAYQPTDHMEAFFRIENLLDEEYASNQGFIFDAQPGAPRTFLAGLKVTF
jgi:iron complex outermembrane receptor protein